MEQKEKELYDKLNEKFVSRQEIFDGRVLHVVKDTVLLPNGHESTREVVLHNGAVCVVPITEDGEVIMERQYRYPFDSVLWEIPAGKLENGETDREAAAARELREETGYVADKLIYMGDFYGSPAIVKERVSMYLATGLKAGERELDEDEFLDVVKVPIKDMVDMILRGEVPDGKTQVAVMRVYLEHFAK